MEKHFLAHSFKRPSAYVLRQHVKDIDSQRTLGRSQGLKTQDYWSISYKLVHPSSIISKDFVIPESIDWIVETNSEVIFVEVKTRSDGNIGRSALFKLAGHKDTYAKEYPNKKVIAQLWVDGGTSGPLKMTASDSADCEIKYLCEFDQMIDDLPDEEFWVHYGDLYRQSNLNFPPQLRLDIGY